MGEHVSKNHFRWEELPARTTVRALVWRSGKTLLRATAAGGIYFGMRCACLLFAIILGGCTSPSKPSPDQLREKAAEATSTLKNDATAIAQGVREGWKHGSPVELNSCSREELLSLPGMTEQEADRILAGRPYRRAADLRTRHIISDQQYRQIQDKITVKGPAS